MKTIPHLLILCTGNSCRSQMAEGFFRHLAQGRLEVSSAGLDPKPIHPLAIQVMAEVGIDISAQTSKGVKPFLGMGSITLVITVCERAEEHCPRIFPFTLKREFWPFSDPASVTGEDQVRLEAFRLTRDCIQERIQTWFQHQEATGSLPKSGQM